MNNKTATASSAATVWLPKDYSLCGGGVVGDLEER